MKADLTLKATPGRFKEIASTFNPNVVVGVAPAIEKDGRLSVCIFTKFESKTKYLIEGATVKSEDTLLDVLKFIGEELDRFRGFDDYAENGSGK